MQTKKEMLLDLLGQPNVQFVIPAYQRLYSWQERQCKELWLDLHRAARSQQPHFIGTLLYSREAANPSTSQQLAVIDGQQRLTTLTLILVALARHLRERNLALPDATAQDIERRYLRITGGEQANVGRSGKSIALGKAANVANESEIANPATAESACAAESARATASAYASASDKTAANTYVGESAPAAERADKLVLSRNDRATLSAVLHNAALPEGASENVTANLAFFQGKMEEEGFSAEALWRGIQQLFVISAEVGSHDNAQLIFESLNSKGMPLTTADLVRNYLLLAETHSEQTRLYDEYWGPIEGMFVPDPGSLRLDNAIQGWLSVRFRKVRAKGAGEVYSVFKQYVEDEFDGTTESLLKELRNFCLIWAENYRYHAVKKYRSAFDWATNGNKTLVSNYATKKSDSEAFARKTRETMAAVDASM